jgi:carbon monoxide dehydrogenase subunit G
MKLHITHDLAADRERVFDALVDPAVMQRCIPGVESMVETAPDTYDATLKIGIAGLKGTYTGRTTIANKQRPDSLTLGLEGKGAPGFVRGTAAVALSSADGHTKIACDADVQVGGLIAAVGSRLVEAAARKMAADFFKALEQQVNAG